MSFWSRLDLAKLPMIRKIARFGAFSTKATRTFPHTYCQLRPGAPTPRVSFTLGRHVFGPLNADQNDGVCLASGQYAGVSQATLVAGIGKGRRGFLANVMTTQLKSR